MVATLPTIEQYYYLIPKHSGKALTTIGGNVDGAQVVQWTNDKVDHFKWLLEDAFVLFSFGTVNMLLVASPTMKKLSSFILVVLLFISTLFFVNPNAFAISDSKNFLDQSFQQRGFNQGVLFATDENNELFTPSVSPTSGFNISNSEIKTLITLFKNPQSAYSSSIVINNIKYVPMKASSEAIFATKDEAKRATSGVVAVKIDANRIAVGIYDDPSFDLNDASLRDFLASDLKNLTR